MRIVFALALFAGIVCVSSSSLLSQDKKEAPKLTKGQLPANWGKLELTQDQKSAIYKVQAKYKEEIAKLQDTIKEKQLEERREMVKLLTPEQKKMLEQLATGETTKEEPKKVAPSKEK